MAKAERLLEFSEGALVLLRIARRHDLHRAMARNAALLAVLKFAEELVRECKSGSLENLFLLTRRPSQNFLTLTAAILKRIHEQVNEQFGSGASTIPVVTDFNRHVMAGFAEALADIAWPKRAANDFDGPSPEEFRLRLAQEGVETLWRGILQNYLANILQDYFATLRIRESVPDLEPTTEVDLRLVDARAIAEFAMQLAANLGEARPEPALIAFALDQAIDEIVTEDNRQ